MEINRLIHIFRWFLILLIPFVLVIGSISALTNDYFLSYEYAKSNFPADPFGFTTQERLRHAADNLRFIRQGLPPSYLEGQTHDGQPLYNPREVSHMVDVQAVFQMAWNYGKVLLIIILCLIPVLTWQRKNRVTFFSSIQQAGYFSTSLIAVIGLLAIFGWNTWFTAFHQIFFQPGTWTFEATDTLIRLFPLPFWFDSAITLSVLTFGSGLLLVILGGLFKKKFSKPFQV